MHSEHVEEEIDEPKYKRYLLTGISIFLIFLMVSYSALSFGLGEIFISLIITSPIEDYTIIDDVTVIFENNTFEQIQNVYLETQEYEIKLCLLGSIEDNYTVTSIYEPKIYFQAFNKVISEGCSENTIISLHSHPHRHCIASQQDLITLEQLQKNNPKAIIGVMCELNRINFYN